MQAVGFRSIAFSASQGFFLNGKPYDLHGVAFHEDRLNKGFAVSDADVVLNDASRANTHIVADINGTGVIKTERKGEAAMLIRYEGKLAVLNVTVLTPKQGFEWKPMPEANYIDRFINA